MKWDQKRLTTYLNQPEVKHDEYLSEKKLWEVLASLYKLKKILYLKKHEKNKFNYWRQWLYSI